MRARASLCGKAALKCSAFCSNCLAKFARSPFAAFTRLSISAICGGVRFGFCLLLLDRLDLLLRLIDGTLNSFECRFRGDRLGAGGLRGLIERRSRFGRLAGLEERDAVVIAQQAAPTPRAPGRRSSCPSNFSRACLSASAAACDLVLFAKERRERDVRERRDRRLLKRVVGELPQHVDRVPLVALQSQAPSRVRDATPR